MNSSNNYELLLAPNKLNHSTLFVLFLGAGRAGALGWGLAAAGLRHGAAGCELYCLPWFLNIKKKLVALKNSGKI